MSRRRRTRSQSFHWRQTLEIVAISTGIVVVAFLLRPDLKFIGYVVVPAMVLVAMVTPWIPLPRCGRRWSRKR
jgi:hypothetical protein